MRSSVLDSTTWLFVLIYEFNCKAAVSLKFECPGITKSELVSELKFVVEYLFYYHECSHRPDATQLVFVVMPAIDAQETARKQTKHNIDNKDNFNNYAS